MTHARLLGLTAAAAGALLLSGCVVAPPAYYGATPYAASPYGPAYVEPAPVVVAPPPVSFGIYGGYYRPWRGGGGYRHWR